MIYAYKMQIIIVGGGRESFPHESHLNITTYESLMQSVPADLTQSDLPRLQLPSVDNRQLVAMIGYSSGTTGRPKGCMHSHYSLIVSACNNQYV